MSGAAVASEQHRLQWVPGPAQLREPDLGAATAEES